jgi:hypothetical protein
MSDPAVVQDQEDACRTLCGELVAAINRTEGLPVSYVVDALAYTFAEALAAAHRDDLTLALIDFAGCAKVAHRNAVARREAPAGTSEPVKVYRAGRMQDAEISERLGEARHAGRPYRRGR